MKFRAELLAREAHRGQRYGDDDYFEGHIRRVVNKAHELFLWHEQLDTMVVCAYLHDVLEDSDITVDALTEIFGGYIANKVEYLTRQSGEPYTCYIDRITEDTIAAHVKYADSFVNLEKCIETRDFKRAEKYLGNLQRLKKFVEEDL